MYSVYTVDGRECASGSELSFIVCTLFAYKTTSYTYVCVVKTCFSIIFSMAPKKHNRKVNHLFWWNQENEVDVYAFVYSSVGWWFEMQNSWSKDSHFVIYARICVDGYFLYIFFFFIFSSQRLYTIRIRMF